jgi:hypothetical protein
MIQILTDKNLMFIQALFDYQPNAVDEQQAVAWLTLMEKAYCNFQRYSSHFQWQSSYGGRNSHIIIHNQGVQSVFRQFAFIIPGWMQSCVRNLVSNCLRHVWRFSYLIMLLSRRQPQTQWRLVIKWSVYHNGQMYIIITNSQFQL